MNFTWTFNKVSQSKVKVSLEKGLPLVSSPVFRQLMPLQYSKLNISLNVWPIKNYLGSYYIPLGFSPKGDFEVHPICVCIC